MIAACILLFPRLDLGKRQSPELAAPDDQRTVVQPALFEVRQQSAHRPVGFSTAVGQIFLQVGMVVPDLSFHIDLYHSHAPFH